jgi:hypothetical protein
MPPAKKTPPPRPRSGAFKEPAALKRLSKSLDTAHEALAELRKDTGRDVGQGARDVYKDLRAFVSNARRDTSKLAKALARDFDRAERRVAQTGASRRSRSAATAGRSKRSRPAAKPPRPGSANAGCRTRQCAAAA